MSNIIFKADDGVQQLVQATQLLIDESIYVFANLSIDEFNDRELNRLAKVLLNNIDKTQHMITAITSLPNEQIVECRIKLQQAIDKLYVCLTSTHQQYQQLLLSGELDNNGAVAYADFCWSLSLKLLERATAADMMSLPEPTVIDDELEEYL